MTIIRRDFLNGVAISIAAGTVTGCMRPIMANASAKRVGPDAPPVRTGLLPTDSAYTAAHALRDGQAFAFDEISTDERYDLVIVGAGISGLAAAHFHRKKRPDDRILLIDALKDFGGHARRNEFDVDGKLLIGYGGTQSIESPGAYSPVAIGLLASLGIDVSRFQTAFDQTFYDRAGLRRATFFGKERFTEEKLVKGPPSSAYGNEDPEMSRPAAASMQSVLNEYPLSAKGRELLVAIETSETDPLAGKSVAEKRQIIEHTSYAAFLRTYWQATDEVLACYRNRLLGLWGCNLDGLSASGAFSSGLPGGQGIVLPPEDGGHEAHEPYIYHFPDGNASIARMLIRELVPGSTPGSTMEDIVLAPVDYATLDRATNAVRVRLESTAVSVRNKADRVEIGYVQAGKLRKVEAGACVLACYNMMIPYMVTDLPDAQREALSMNVKVPLVYINVALRNWRAWQKLGVSSVFNPAGSIASMSLDFPVSLGRYQFAHSSDDPIIVHMLHVPAPDDEGLDMRSQYRIARQKIYETDFASYEATIRSEMTRILGPGGFDFDRDVAGITVNRWAHGYAYTPDPLWDDPAEQETRVALARQPFGRIHIANSDAGWDAYTNVAIDEAWRAINEIRARG